jgi:hypothetical protein
MTASETSVGRYFQLIRAEYRESPGLCLRPSQIGRLWQLDEATCDVVLAALVATGVLRCTRDGCYVRADEGELSANRRARLMRE